MVGRLAALAAQIMPSLLLNRAGSQTVAASTATRRTGSQETRSFTSITAGGSLEELLTPAELKRFNVEKQLQVELHPQSKTLCISFNRPQQLNCLSLPIVRYLNFLFPQVARSSRASCRAILVRGLGGKAFCAGGDVKWLTTQPKPEEAANEFFALEYGADYGSSVTGRTYISIWEGLVFGGGVGISIHGNIRVATEDTVLAMPETTIGFFPDVGASHFLSRLEDGIGLYLGMVGHRLNAADVLDLRLATHFIPRASVPDFVRSITTNLPSGISMTDEYIQELLSTIKKNSEDNQPRNPTLTPEVRESIKRYFHTSSSHESAQDFETVWSRLQAGAQHGDTFAQETVLQMRKMCPLSLYVWFRLHRLGRSMLLWDCFDMEYRVSRIFLKEVPNMREGVRALLVDRSNDPAWLPSRIEDLDLAAIDQVFDKCMISKDLSLPRPKLQESNESSSTNRNST